MNSPPIPSHDWITQVGVGGTFVVLVLMLVLNFLKSKRQNGTAGDKSVEFWEQRLAVIISSATAQAVTGSMSTIAASLAALTTLLTTRTAMFEEMRIYLKEISQAMAEERGRAAERRKL